MTRKELEKRIRMQTIEAVEKFQRLEKTKMPKTEKEMLKKQFQALQETAGTYGRNGLLGLGFRGKIKQQLQIQSSMLQSFNLYFDRTKKERQKQRTRVRKAYNTFKQHGYADSISMEEFENLGNIFGALGDKIKNQFGSGNIIELYSSTAPENRHNLVKTMLDVYNNARGKGYTREQLFDAVYDRLVEDAENE